MRVKGQKLALPQHELKFDATSAQQLVGYLRIQDKKLQGMMLWCCIAVLIGYLSVIFAILQFYSTLPGQHTSYLAAALILIYLLFGIFLWLQFRISTYKPTQTQVRLKEFCQFKIQVTRRQIKLLTGCLLAYALIVFVSCIACWLEAEDNNGAEKLFRITAPVSIIVYVIGLYLLAKLGVRWHSLNDDISGIDREILKGFGQQ